MFPRDNNLAVTTARLVQKFRNKYWSKLLQKWFFFIFAYVPDAPCAYWQGIFCCLTI